MKTHNIERRVLGVLREPLELGTVTISRATRRADKLFSKVNKV